MGVRVHGVGIILSMGTANYYGRVLMSWCTKNRHFSRKIYDCSGRLISVPEYLLTALEHLLTALEHFRTCSVSLTNCSRTLLGVPEDLLTAREHFLNCSGTLS